MWGGACHQKRLCRNEELSFETLVADRAIAAKIDDGKDSRWAVLCIHNFDLQAIGRRDIKCWIEKVRRDKLELFILGDFNFTLHGGV